METATKPDVGVEAVGGLLLVDKPAGITSHDVVSIVRRAAHTRRVGHTGTLDPFATGLLVVLVGRGTRLIPYVEGDPKVYEATIRLGIETDTDDSTGSVVREVVSPSDDEIAHTIQSLSGVIQQIPPSFSAKQVDGRRAYDAARKGTPLELAPVSVVVHDWTVLGRDGDDLHVRISCGTGTYIRALARDLGHLTQSAAHLSALRRLRCGAFDVANAATISDLKAGEFELSPLKSAIPSILERTLTPLELGKVAHGNAIDAHDESGRVALIDDHGDLVAVAEREGAQLRPRLVLRDA
ncbi:MAG TPA: tRNA pseudouridine(55) synthase TruB [Gemmatimonadaceae bacterium]|jgi:tRNA pseudouridine55 synthase